MNALVGEEVFDVVFDGVLNKKGARAVDILLKKEGERKSYPLFWTQIFYLSHLYLSRHFRDLRLVEEGIYWYVRYTPVTLLFEYRKEGLSDSFALKGPDVRAFLSRLCNMVSFYGSDYTLMYTDRGLVFWFYRERNKEGVYGLEVRIGSRKIDLDRSEAFEVAFSEVDMSIPGKFRLEKDRLLLGRQVFEGEEYVKLIRGACRLLVILR